MLGIGESATVIRVVGEDDLFGRLMEMGITAGATVEVIRFAPLGDPVDIRVRGYHLSLRRHEAESVIVSAV